MNKVREIGPSGSKQLMDRVLHAAVKAFCDCPFSWSSFEEFGIKQGISGAELAVGSVLLRRAGELSVTRLADGRVEYTLNPSALHRSYDFYWGERTGLPADQWEDSRKGGAIHLFRLLAYIGLDRIPLNR
ncbi:MAG: hypothetical protein K6T85_10085, partial [Gorillibacterium sp.]|nr:hypothetical protein [Gorillibacterium sp.]